MTEYHKNIDNYKKHLSLLSKQIIIDLKAILLDKVIEYELNRTNSDIVIYLFEYGFELFDLTFYGLDKKFDSYTKHISLPTKFPDEKHKCLTPKSVVLFEQKKFINSCEGKTSDKEKKEFSEYLEERKNIFEKWFFSSWEIARTGIDCKKGIYFSIHDTNERIDLLTMETIKDNEIMKKLNLE